jgi:hypothetical protein
VEGFCGVEAGIVPVARSEFELGQRQQRLGEISEKTALSLDLDGAMVWAMARAV